MAIPFRKVFTDHLFFTPLIWGAIFSLVTGGFAWFIFKDLPPDPPLRHNLIRFFILLAFCIASIAQFILIRSNRRWATIHARRSEENHQLLADYTLESHAVYDEHHHIYETGRPLPEPHILRATLMPNGDLMDVFSLKSPTGATLRGMTVWKRNTPLA